jgi:Xaa-Pro aminopeptidase
VKEIGPERYARRLHDLAAYVGARLVECLIVSTPRNITYLTGFSGSAGLLVVSRESAWLLVDGRYEGLVRTSISAGKLAAVNVERVTGRYEETLRDVLVREDLRRVGFEAEHVTVAVLTRWHRAASDVTFEPTRGVVEGQRMVKDDDEVAIFRRGAGLLADVAGGLAAIVRRGRTEQDVAAAIDAALVASGFDRPSFETIVASGPNSALPHARPTPRRLAEGDLVVLDFGGVLGGYCLDLTRMAAVGQVSSSAMALYEGVREANVAAVRAVRPGVRTSDVDRAARDVLEDRNLGDAFLHATGHGLGLDIHEAPRLAKPDGESPQRLAPGMIFTIEPGAYVAGVGGVRLEDDVLVTPGGSEVLTRLSHDLLRV